MPGFFEGIVQAKGRGQLLAAKRFLSGTTAGMYRQPATKIFRM